MCLESNSKEGVITDAHTRDDDHLSAVSVIELSRMQLLADHVVDAKSSDDDIGEERSEGSQDHNDTELNHDDDDDDD